MNDNNIRIKADGDNIYDKYVIAATIRNSTYKDEFQCSLKNNRVIESCENCGLKFICNRIDRICNEFIEKTSNAVHKFLI